MNIAELVSRRAAERPDAVAFEEPGPFTYGELDRAIGQVAHHLARQGIAPGTLVAVAMVPSGIHMIVLLALAHLGAISMPITPAKAQARRDTIARRFGPAFLISRREENGVAGVPFLRLDPDWFQVPESFRPAPPAPGGDAPWRLNLTSGTTGDAKGVAWTHASTIALFEHYKKFSPFPPGSRLLCNRGMDMGFMLRYCMHALFSGGTILFQGTPAMQDFIRVVRRHNVTHAIVEPAFLQKLVAAVPTREPCLPGVQALTVGGGVMSAALRDAAVAKLTPNVYDSHGASETGLTALGDPELRRRRPEVTGRIVPWVEAQAVDDADRPLPEGEPGVLRYRSPLFAREYYKDPEASARGFRGGWFYPGDVGSVAGGLLTLHSRADEVINLGGLKVNPVSVEAVLLEHPEVSEAAVFAARRSKGVALTAAVVKRGSVTERELLEFCRGRLGRQAPSAIIEVESLPRNDAGKLLRRELPALAAGQGSDAG